MWKKGYQKILGSWDTQASVYCVKHNQYANHAKVMGSGGMPFGNFEKML